MNYLLQTYSNLVNSVLIIELVLLINFKSQGQDSRISRIDEMVKEINVNTKLTVREFDASEVYGKSLHGSGSIKVYSHKNEILKIEQEIDVSFGRLTTMMYVESGKPIQIIEREENFKIKDDQSSMDYSILKEVFRATIYILDWDTDNSKVIYSGKRVLSEGTCSNFEYEPLLEEAQKLINK